MPLVVGGIYWSRDGNMLLHICHSPWVAYIGVIMAYSYMHASYKVAHTGDIVICSCIYVTRCGWHILESWQCARANMSLAVGGMCCRLSRACMRISHSPWVTCNGDVVVCSCAHVTRCGWHILES